MHPMLNIAIKAARRAGGIIQRGARDLDRLTVTSKGPKDFVSEVDKAAEAAIVETLLEAYPDHGILAEEGTVNAGAKNPDNVWVIDPLDGTTNFLHGFPQYCVSVALSHKGVITQGVVYDPNRNDLFTSTRGAGAYLNDRRLRVSRRIRMDEALVATGFPFRDGSMVETYLDMMRDMIHRTAGIRRAGAAALDLAHVAAGWYEGFWEVGLNPWDMAAGSLLVQESGGLVADIHGDETYLENGSIIAATPKIFSQMVQTLSPHMKKAQSKGASSQAK
ncbi:MAG: inositol monophosphatase family protein [Betaproteobacteria bacterium]